VPRYLILAEGYSGDSHYGKTARGVVRYRREDVACLLDSKRLSDELDGIPIVETLEEALVLEPDTALVGVATQGGRFPPEWRDLLKRCITAGLDVESGLHEFMGDDQELSALAREHGVELRDLRRPPDGLTVPTGENLQLPTTIVHTVGSECAIGKKTVALELDLEARRRGRASRFVPTGQTGIVIAGWGVAVDAVVADFIAGASEWLVVEGYRRGGEELLFVEGQGSLVHPAYSGVTMGLLHGCAPHLLVLCHRAGQTAVEGYPEHPIPPLPEVVALYEAASLPARRARVAGIALNTADLDDAAAPAAISAASAETGLPVDDPVRFGAGPLLDAVVA
jgi:D-glutamate N-acetyltransferase